MAYIADSNEDFAARRSVVRRMIETPFRHPFEFVLEIDGQPPNFDVYIKDLSYGPIEIETGQVKVGGITINVTEGTGLVTLSMTTRDDKKGTIRNWFAKWASAVYNSDGTWNLPVKYLREARKYELDKSRRGRLAETWKLMPTQLGDIEETTDGGASLFTFPLTMMQYRSLG